MKNFLLSLFNINAKDYSRDKSSINKSNPADIYRAQEHFYFGRAKLSSNMLSTHGIESLNNILKNFKEDYPNMTYCPLLPRVAQFFLWFVPPNIASIMIDLLIKETLKEDSSPKDARASKLIPTKFFSTNIQFSKSLVRMAMSTSKKDKKDKKVQKIISDMIEEMFVNSISVEVITN